MVKRLNDLPQELLNHIVRLSELNASTLCTLCLTSRRFIHEARLHLYANISISIPSHLETFRPRIHVDFKRSKSFFTTLVIHNPSLAKHVKCFVYSQYFPHDPEIFGHQDLMLRGLRLMTNIKILELIPVDANTIPANLFEGCTFQLTHFHCNFNCSRQFLLTQHTLQSLYLEWDVEDIPSDCFTNLRTLRVKQWNDIPKIFPGRPIRHLDLTRVVSYEPLAPIVLEIRNITVLDFRCSTAARSHALESMIPYLTHLSLLRIRCVTAFMMKLLPMPGTILGLPNLRIFIWSSISEPEIDRDIINLESQRKMVNVWFQKMPKFEAAYFQVANAGDAQKIFARWLVNDTTPTLVDREEVLPGHGLYDSRAEEYEFTSARH